MSREYTAVPTDVLEAQQEARELENINQATKANLEEHHRVCRTAAMEEESSRQAQAEAIRRLAGNIFAWTAGCATLVLLAHGGAIAGWLMHIGTTVWTFVLGHQIGKLSLGGHYYEQY